MAERRVGLWLIGAVGGVGATATLGLSALRRGLAEPVGLTTALPEFAGLDLDAPAEFVVGGHDIRQATFADAVQELYKQSHVFSPALLAGCARDLDDWSANLRPGTLLGAGETITRLGDRPDLVRFASARAAITQVQRDLHDFRTRHRLEQVVVLNVASTEPPFTLTPAHATLAQLDTILDQPDALPASSVYAYAALDLGWPYVNFTPSTGAGIPALAELAQLRQAVFGGKDGKTGETLLKSVLAPMFAERNLQVLSWVGHNIFGNRDGIVLNNPSNKASKIRTKDALLAQLLGYKPQSHVSIEYIESLGDWKTAWDHIHFAGFLGTKMTLQFTWQGCDSLLAAPLVLDLARLALFAQRQGQVGVLSQLACFFKSPMGDDDHHFGRQFAKLVAYAAQHHRTPPVSVS
jgi:myo-inositol-1-phosphate synthase